MSGRSGGRDKKGAKGQTDKHIATPTVVQNSKATDKTDNPTKAPQATAEQIRIAHMIQDPKRNDIPDIDKRIEKVMELTSRSWDEASIALNDCDYDVGVAINSLLEGSNQGEWKTSTRKARKPPPQPSAAAPVTESKPPENKPPETDSGGDKENKPDYPNKSMRDKTNNYRGPPRLRRGGGGGGGGGGGDKRWRSRERQENEKNLMESGEGNRGRGRGRRDRGQRGRGPRMFQNRQRFENTEFPQSIDTWNNSQVNNMEPFTTGSWGDTLTTTTNEEVWDNDDYAGDVAIESKVFTPSQALDASPDPLAAVSLSESIDLSSLLQQKPSQTSEQTAQDVFNTQATESLKAAIGVGQTSSSYGGGNSTYGSNSRDFAASSYNTNSASNYSSNSGYSAAFSAASQYSAIHSDYTVSQQSYSSSTGVSQGYSSTTQGYTTSTTPTSYSCSVSSQTPAPPKKSLKPRMSSKIPSEAVEMPRDCVAELGITLEGLAFGTSTFNDIAAEATFPSTSTSAVVTSAVTADYSQQLTAARTQSTKIAGADSGITSFSSSESKPERNAQSYVATSTSPKPSETLGGFSVSHQSSYKPSAYHNVSSTYSTGSQSQSASSNNYPGTTNSGYTAQQQPGAYPNSQQQNSYTTSSSYTSSYPTYSSSSYQSYPSVSQSYSLTPNQYSASYPPPATTATLLSANSKLTNALVKDVQFDSSGSTASQPGVSASLGFASSVTTQSTKSVTTTSKAGNIPSGVAGVPTALVGTPHPFVMGQTGLHFAPYAAAQLQQPMVGYEDLSLIHPATAAPRLPVQATSRDTSLAAFSMNESVGGIKYGGGRGDTSTSSPVQTTTPQTQPQFISQFPPAYFYYGGMVPGNFPQYGTSVYPMNNMVPPASNTHTGVSSAQFPKTVTAATVGQYVHFNSYNDSQDYGKTKNNVQATQQQSAQSNDLAAMYNNRKIASLDKGNYQGMGTPPPFAAGSSYATPVFFPTAVPNQQHPIMQIPPDSSTGSGQRGSATGQSKASTKQAYPNFWT